MNTLTDPAEINDDDIKPNEWSAISIDLKANTDGDSGNSFASIKTDDSVDPNDNGQWILLIGYSLIALGVLGILYFIVTTLNARKEAERERRHNGTNRPSAARSSASRTAPAREEAPARASVSRSSGSRSTESRRTISRHASKEDTAEIYIPRRAQK